MIREQYKTLRFAKLEKCASYDQADLQPLHSITLESPHWT